MNDKLPLKGWWLMVFLWQVLEDRGGKSPAELRLELLGEPSLA